MTKKKNLSCYRKLEFSYYFLILLFSPFEYIFTLPLKLLLKWVKTLSPLIKIGLRSSK